MRKVIGIIAATGLMSLAACNNSPTEQKADNVEQAAEDQADNIEEQADNAGTEASEDNLENSADAVRSEGKNEADAVREGNSQKAFGRERERAPCPLPRYLLRSRAAAEKDCAERR